ncbi:unnamed protein product [Cyprideis torosa]|uniref:Uncharacterized protein n=1 Tax=Cyprideis torosa TaxID=163714 RepID=A0A7R8WHY8_9CRUS|nr:unnamed protein product [Cyprideis torosa]CAG0894607.1 unnamed protein product [Cyprideis torosa]
MPFQLQSYAAGYQWITEENLVAIDPKVVPTDTKIVGGKDAREAFISGAGGGGFSVAPAEISGSTGSASLITAGDYNNGKKSRDEFIVRSGPGLTHPQYDPIHYWNDIALIFVIDDFPLGRGLITKIQAANLPPPTQRFNDGTCFVVVGWGHLEAKPGPPRMEAHTDEAVSYYLEWIQKHAMM